MNSPQDWFEKEEEALFEKYERGELTNAELQLELRELRRDYASAAREAATEAYEREEQRWW